MNILSTDARAIRLLIVAILAAFFVAGCSDSPEPEESGGGGTPYTDVPEIPEPTTPGGETGAISDTVTVIVPLTTHYRPMVRSAFSRWGLSTRCCQRPVIISDWTCTNWVIIVGMQEMWSDALPELNIDQCAGLVGEADPVSISRPDPWQRFLLVEDGQVIQPEEGDSGDETIWYNDDQFIIRMAQIRLHWQTRAIAERPHLRRDRFWVRQPLLDVGNFLILVGDVEGSISTTRTWGSSTTETEEFGRSVTASSGLNFGALSLGVEVTLSQTFSTAVTVSEETSDTFSQTVTGEDGKIVHYQVWQLVEYYTITDADGAPFTDPNYTFVLSEFTIRNGALALVATKFDS